MKRNADTRGFKVHHIYFILALFDILTVSGSLYLNHQIMGIYVQSVDVNQTWATRLMHITKLSTLAGGANAPGNDVFDSGDVESETIRRDQELERFNKQMKLIRRDISNNVRGDQRAPIIVHLNAVQIAMDRMIDETNLIFTYFIRREPGNAGKRMATMDRKYADVRLGLAELSKYIAQLQAKQFTAQIKAAEKLRQFEYAIGCSILLMVILVTIYGHRISRMVKKAEREKKQHLRLLEEKQVALLESEERSRGVLEAVADGIIILDEKGIIQQANPAVETHFGYRPEELIGQSLDLLLFSPISNSEPTNLRGRKHELETVSKNKIVEVLGERKGGASFPIEFSLNSMGFSEKHMYTGVLRDITDRKRSELEIKKLALTDDLTGLANRNQFHKALEIALKMAVQKGTKIAILFLDLDKFKQVNDTYGHPGGDKLLCEVAQRLLKTVRDKDTVARLGGDEFAIILTDLDSSEFPEMVANRIVENITQPISIGDQHVKVGTSIGISVYPDDDTDVDELIKKADLALYQAKDSGRGLYKNYDERIHALMMDKQQLEDELLLAVSRNEFVLYYQPQLDLTSNRLVGAEALIRWEHPSRGLLQPGAFLDIAESSKLILSIDMWVLESVCKQLRIWHQAGFKSLHVSANISARHFQDPALVDRLGSLLTEYKVDPNWLELEVTESAMMDQVETVTETINCLNRLGVGVAIDDFGTGYSSLAYLSRFRVHRLKIDRSFIREITINGGDAVISQAIINLGHNLNLRVIAEGVESEDQLCFLREHGCDEVQGYLISKPITADVFMTWAREFTEDLNNNSVAVS